MTAASVELQKAVFEALTEDAPLTAALGGTRIYDHAPASVPFPYVTLGRVSIYDWSTGTEAGAEQLFTLHVWSKAKGKKEIFGLMDRISCLLHDADFALGGHHLVSLRTEYSEAVYDDDLAVHHGLLRFRAVTEDAA